MNPFARRALGNCGNVRLHLALLWCCQAFTVSLCEMGLLIARPPVAEITPLMVAKRKVNAQKKKISDLEIFLLVFFLSRFFCHPISISF